MANENANKKSLKEQKQELYEVKSDVESDIKEQYQIIAKLRARKRELQNKLENKIFDFWWQTGTILSAGIGATAGMIPGSLDRVGGEITQNMALGGIAGALVGGAVPILIHFYQKRSIRKQIENLDNQIKAEKQDLKDYGEKKRDFDESLQKLESAKTTKQARKQARKQFRVEVGLERR